VRICGSSTSIRLGLSASEKKFSDYLLGADVSVQAVIKGYDELGRAVAVKVDL